MSGAAGHWTWCWGKDESMIALASVLPLCGLHVVDPENDHADVPFSSNHHPGPAAAKRVTGLSSWAHAGSGLPPYEEESVPGHPRDPGSAAIVLT